MANADPTLRPPRQERSRRTLQRVLDVTESLLAERRFEDIPVSEIVRRAGTSVGAFYSRFRDKDALLPALYERYDRWVSERASELARTQPWRGRDLSGVCAWIVSELSIVFRERKYLMRAVTLHARARPEKIGTQTRERRVAQMGFLRNALLEHCREMNHPDPDRAVDFAIFMAASVCRELILFADAPHAASMSLGASALEPEISRQMLAYLVVTTESA